MPAPTDTAEPALVVEDTGAVLRVRFPVLVVEGMDAGDGRLITPGGFGCRPLPLSIAAQPYDPHGGQPAPAAEVLGHITTAERHPGPEVISPSTGEPFPEGVFVWSAEGEIDANHRWANLVRKGYLRGVSVVMGEMDAELIGEEEAALSDNPRRWAVVNSANIACVTLVPVPAFADTHLELADDDTAMVAAAQLPSELHAEPVPPWLSLDLGDEVAAVGDLAVPMSKPELVVDDAVTASGETRRPPLAWFVDPGFTEETPITIEEVPGSPYRHVFGHIGSWSRPHIGFNGGKVHIPRSRCDYAEFLRGGFRVDDNGTPRIVAVGHLTMDTGHPDLLLTASAAARHYDHTGYSWAKVSIGEDEHGPWVNGVTKLGITEAEIDRALAHPPSGDWRPIPGVGGVELVAVLCVNTPGFGVYRARVASGEVQAMVASSGIPPRASGAAVLDYDTLAAAIASRLRASDADERERAGLLAELGDDDSDEERLAALAGLDEGEEFTALAAFVSEHADADDASFASLMPPQLQRSYLAGKVAARIVWGTPGDFRRCVVQAKGHGMGRKAEGACNYLHNKAVGFYPGDRRNK